ncbi:MAG: hypothetical protein LBU66_04440 [Treponema sp.]|nr:hypothetical protein [Treponema sp.]
MNMLSWKKYLLPAALIAVFALVFAGLMSCDGDDSKTYNYLLVGKISEISFDTQNGYFTETGLGFKRLKTGSNGKISPPDSEEVYLYQYKFREWNTSPNGHGVKLTSGTVHNRDTIYYAVWDQDIFWEEDLKDYSNVKPVQAGGSNTWVIEGAELQKIINADQGSVLRLHFDATGGQGANRNNWGIGSIGNGGTDVMDFMPLRAPAGSEMIYFIDIENDWVLDVLDRGAPGAGVYGNKLIVSADRNNGDILKKILLLQPKEPRDPGERPGAPEPPPANLLTPIPDGTLVGLINITFGTSGDITQGKGDIAGADLQLIRDTVNGLNPNERRVVLRLFTRNETHPTASLSWNDCGTIGGNPPSGYQIGGSPIGTNRVHIFTHAQVVHLLAPNRPIVLNPYNGNVITRIELWTVPFKFIKLTAGTAEVTNIEVFGRSGEIAYIGNTGFTFGPTGNSRNNYAHFEMSFPAGKTLRDYKEVKFDYQVLTTGGASARMGLFASHTPINAALATHFTGSSGLAAPLGSSNGWLAANQVTTPMVPSLTVANYTAAPVEVTLEIIKAFDPVTLTVEGQSPVAVPAAAQTALTNALNANKLWFAIYENTTAATIRITNIKFIEND